MHISFCWFCHAASQIKDIGDYMFLPMCIVHMEDANLAHKDSVRDSLLCGKYKKENKNQKLVLR